MRLSLSRVNELELEGHIATVYNRQERPEAILRRHYLVVHCFYAALSRMLSPY